MKIINCLIILWLLACRLPADDATLPPSKPERELFTGNVIPLSEALKKREIDFTEEVANHRVLETDDGELIPILADWRGRAFYQDERLCHRKVQLIGIRRRQIPYLQVLMVYTFDDQTERMFTDYWCDICAIAMYEIKACECCQGEIRLRFTPRDLPPEFSSSPAQPVP